MRDKGKCLVARKAGKVAYVSESCSGSVALALLRAGCEVSMTDRANGARIWSRAVARRENYYAEVAP